MISRSRKVTHKWTTENRIVLIILKRMFENKEVAPLFNHVFRTQLSIEGFTNGIRPIPLISQFAEIKGGGKGHELLTYIETLRDTEIPIIYSQTQRKIEEAIKTLRYEPYRKISGQRHSRRPRRRQLPASSPETTSASTAAHFETVTALRLHQFSYHESPYFANQNPPNTPSSPEPLIDRDNPINIARNRARNRPQLLFRSASMGLLLRSRAVASGRILSPPPVFNSKSFIDIVVPHLQRDRRYISPFVSTAQNPRTSIRRLHTACSEGTEEQKLFLAIFAFDDLAKAQDQSTSDCGPFLARMIDLPSYLPDNYQGQGEWLCYGAIQCDPIAIMDSNQVILMVEGLHTYSRTGYLDDLRRAGEILLTVQGDWKEIFVTLLIKHYIRGRTLSQRKAAHEVLMQRDHLLNSQLSRITQPLPWVDLGRVDRAYTNQSSRVVQTLNTMVGQSVTITPPFWSPSPQVMVPLFTGSYDEESDTVAVSFVHDVHEVDEWEMVDHESLATPDVEEIVPLMVQVRPLETGSEEVLPSIEYDVGRETSLSIRIASSQDTIN